MTDVATVARGLRPSVKRGLLSPDGQGAYSSSVFNTLHKLGLVDNSFCRTERGEQVRAHLLSGEAS